VNHDPDTAPISAGLFWFCLTTAPLAWLFQEVASWLLLTFACAAPGSGSEMPLGLAVGAISVVALALVAVAFVTSVRLFMHHRDAAPGRIAGQRLATFQGALALLINAIFLLAIFWASWSLFSLPLCEAGR
jgi:hypothetical protein